MSSSEDKSKKLTNSKQTEVNTSMQMILEENSTVQPSVHQEAAMSPITEKLMDTDKKRNSQAMSVKLKETSGNQQPLSQSGRAHYNQNQQQFQGFNDSFYASTMSKITPRLANQVGPFTNLIDQLKSSIISNRPVEAQYHIQELFQKCQLLNQMAMTHLQSDENEHCLRLLRQAEAVLMGLSSLPLATAEIEQDKRAYSLTLNNFGCYYKKMKRPRIAMKYLKTALNLEKIDKSVTGAEMAATYLNLCAIYVELGHHAEAANKALKAVMLIQTFIKKLKPTIALYDVPLDQDEDIDAIIKHGRSTDSCKYLDADYRERQVTEAALDVISQEDEQISALLNNEIMKKFKPDNVCSDQSLLSSNPIDTKGVDLKAVMGTYSAAYFNLGASFENLKQFSLAKQAYQRSKSISQQYLPENNAIVEQIDQALSQIGRIEEKSSQRKIMRAIMKRNITLNGHQTGPGIIRPQRRTINNMRQSQEFTSNRQSAFSTHRGQMGQSEMLSTLTRDSNRVNNKMRNSMDQKVKMIGTLFANDHFYFKQGQSASKQANLMNCAQGMLQYQTLSPGIPPEGYNPEENQAPFENQFQTMSPSDFNRSTQFKDFQVSSQKSLSKKGVVMPKNLLKQLYRRNTGNYNVISFDAYLQNRAQTRKSTGFGETNCSSHRSTRGLESVNLKFPRDPEELNNISQARHYDQRKPATANGGTRRRAVLPQGAAVLPLNHSLSNSDDSPGSRGAQPALALSSSPVNSRGEIVVRVDTSKYQNSNAVSGSKSMKRQQRYPVIIPTKYKRLNQTGQKKLDSSPSDAIRVTRGY